MKKCPIFKTLLMISFLGIIGIYIYSNPRLFMALRNISMANFLILLFLRFLLMMTNGDTLRRLITKFNITLTPSEWIGIPVITTLGNYIAPFSGGMIARATYLKKRHSLPYSKFVAILSTTYCINYWVLAFIGFAVWFFLTKLTPSSWMVGCIFAWMFLGISGLLFITMFHMTLPGNIGKIFHNIFQGWAVIRQDKMLLIRLVVNSHMIILWQSLSFWIAYITMYQAIPYKLSLLISLMMMFSQIFTILPGNLGLPEALAGMTAGLLGGDIGETLMVSLIIRSVTMLLAFCLGPIFIWLLSRPFSD